MWWRTLSRDEQIDAVLANRLWVLLRRYGFKTQRLQRDWSVSVGDIVSAARQRGLESFVRQSPHVEGFHVIAGPDGYAVAYVERGDSRSQERFDELETAVTHWVRALLDQHGLPHDPGP